MNPANFNYGAETTLAMKEGRVAPDVREEQEKVKNADLIIFQFPFYWHGFPAILKGWFDRVFLMGFAFSLDEMFDQGHFKVY